MKRCRTCGADTTLNRSYCSDCLKAFLDRRRVAFNQAVSELGELCASNLEAIQKRVKELEKTLKEAQP